jgi:hypothetical protein
MNTSTTPVPRNRYGVRPSAVDLLASLPESARCLFRTCQGRSQCPKHTDQHFSRRLPPAPIKNVLIRRLDAVRGRQLPQIP